MESRVQIHTAYINPIYKLAVFNEEKSVTTHTAPLPISVELPVFNEEKSVTASSRNFFSSSSDVFNEEKSVTFIQFKTATPHFYSFSMKRRV